jgi:hypothetical protein
MLLWLLLWLFLILDGNRGGGDSLIFLIQEGVGNVCLSLSSQDTLGVAIKWNR